MAFERVHVARPESAELFQPVVHLLKWFWFQPVETSLRVHRGLHEAGVAEHPQVFRDRGLRQVQPLLDFAHRLLGRGQKAQNRAAVRLGDNFKERGHVLYIHLLVYICQGIYRRGPS